MINLIQKQAENNNYNARKRLLEYDNVLSMHRKIIYELRDSLLELSNFESELSYALMLYLENKLQECKNENVFNEWQKRVKKPYHLDYAIYENENMKQELKLIVNKAIKDIENNVSSLDFIQQFMLMNLNQCWRYHVDSMVDLKRGIELRASGGIKPLDAYKEESYILFKKLWNDYYDLIGNMIMIEEINL